MNIPDKTLAAQVRAKAQRLYAPTGETILPSRHDFNDFIHSVIALCNTVETADPSQGVTITVTGPADPAEVATKIREQLTRDGLVYTQRGAY